MVYNLLVEDHGNGIQICAFLFSLYYYFLLNLHVKALL